MDRDPAELLKAENILLLVKDHKNTCNNENCGIVVYYLLEDFERHIGRKATGEEIKEFL